jgi:hypothetical protein
MSRLTAEERRDLPLEDFGDPERRLFPIVDQADVDAAARLIGKARDPALVRKRILAIAKRKRLQIPDAWQEDEDEPAQFHATGALAEGRPESADVVLYPNSKLFEAGDYPDKRFAMTPEDLWAAVEQFDAPVPVDLEHTPTVLDGALGEVRDLRLSPDGTELFGAVAIPAWLDGLLGPEDRKVSCEWDREARALRRLALVKSPRITDAALMAAFSDYRRKRDSAGDREGGRKSRFRDMVMRWLGLGMPEEFDPDGRTEGSIEPAAEFARDSEVAGLRRKLERMEQERLAADAAAFADGEISARRAVPAERDRIAALYLQAARDDRAQPAVVRFGDCGFGGRVEALRAAFACRQPHPLLDALLTSEGEGRALANMAETTSANNPRAVSAARRRELLGKTTLGQTVLNAARS